MRLLIPVLLAITAVSAALLAAQTSAYESFTLEEQDQIIAEAPGCHVECQVQGSRRRQCFVKGQDCRASCRTLPACMHEGVPQPLKVCAVVKTR